MEKGDAPARPTFPVIRARLLIAFTVSVPFVLWLTPIVQPMNGARALAYMRAVLRIVWASRPVMPAAYSRVYGASDARNSSKPVVSRPRRHGRRVAHPQ